MSNEELHRLLLRRMDSQAEDIKEIRADVKAVVQQTKLTNGRVTKIELWRARIEGGKAAVSWIGTTSVTILASSIGGIVVYLLSK